MTEQVVWFEWDNGAYASSLSSWQDIFGLIQQFGEPQAVVINDKRYRLQETTVNV